MAMFFRTTLLLFALAVLDARAAAPSADIRDSDLAVMRTSLFAQSHPDLLFRLSAIGAIEDGRIGEAFADLQKAARFADKPSQALIAEAYWEGTLGHARDRALAYAWMDLAAERGYPMLVHKRESYWERLDENERKSAISQGQAVFAEFGDAAALPRLDRALRLARKERTGSRTGAAAGSKTYLDNGREMIITFLHRYRGMSMRPTVRGGKEVEFWDDKYWKLDDYLAWKAEAVDGDLTGAGRGRVDILPIHAEGEKL